MKYIILLLLCATNDIVFAQQDGLDSNKPNHFNDTAYYEITLSKELDQSRMGVWRNGDYKICIDMKTLEESLVTKYGNSNITVTSVEPGSGRSSALSVPGGTYSKPVTKSRTITTPGSISTTVTQQ